MIRHARGFSGFPLAAASRRRRRVALAAGLHSPTPEGDSEAAADLPIEAELPAASLPVASAPADVKPAPAEPRHRERTTPVGSASDVGILLSPREEAFRIAARRRLDAGKAGFGAVQMLMADVRPAVWVFTGEGRLASRDGAERVHRSPAESFARNIRDCVDRADDAVIDTTSPGLTAAQLRQTLNTRALRFLPDVVSIAFGADCATGGLESFAHNVRRIVERIRENSAVPLIQTPHRIAGDARLTQKLRSRVRVLRDLARELDVACIDHWDHWKRVESNGTHSWLLPCGLKPNERGEREIMCLLLNRIGIELESASSPSQD